MYHSPDLRHFSVCIVWSQAQNSRASAQNPACRDEGVFQLLNVHDQEMTLDDLLKFGIQSALEEAEEPGSEPESKERTVTLWSWLRGLYWSKLEATTGQGFMRVLACYKEIVKGQKMYLFHQTSLFDSFFQDIVRDSCIATWTVGHWRWSSSWSAYISSGNTSSLVCIVCRISLFFSSR